MINKTTLVAVSFFITLYFLNWALPFFGLSSGTDNARGGSPSEPVLGYRLPKSMSVGGVRFNSFGLRGGEVNVEKNNLVRVLCFGGSTTYGVDVPDNQTWPALLEQILNSSSSGKQFEVLNAGVPGYLSGHSLYRLEHELADLHPDVVVMFDGLNDIISSFKQNPTSVAIRRHLGQDVVNECYIDSKVLKVLSLARLHTLAEFYKIHLLRTMSEEDTNRLVAQALDSYTKNVLRMQEVCTSNGARLVVLDVPWVLDFKFGMPDNWSYLKRHFKINYEDFNAFWYGAKALSQANHLMLISKDIPVLNIQQVFDSPSHKFSLWLDNDYIHYNKVGNFLIAYYLAQFLTHTFYDSGVNFRIEDALPYLLQ